MTLSPRLLNHRARIWRASVSLGPLREEIRALLPVGLPIRCTLRRPSARVSDSGAGLIPQGERVLYCNPGENVEPRDILELLEGPEAPALLEIDSPITRPRGHHIEMTARLWLGELP